MSTDAQTLSKPEWRVAQVDQDGRTEVADFDGATLGIMQDGHFARWSASRDATVVIARGTVKLDMQPGQGDNARREAEIALAKRLAVVAAVALAASEGQLP